MLPKTAAQRSQKSVFEWIHRLLNVSTACVSVGLL